MINISRVTLETERLLLRAFEISDLEDFYEYAKVKGVGEAAGWPHHKNIDETKKILLEFIENKNIFAIYNKKYEKVIGSIGLHTEYDKNVFSDYSNYKILEIGYVLSKEYWSQGFMTEALKKIIEYIFTTLKYDILIAGYFENNYSSEKIQKKLGFKDYSKSVYYSKILDENFNITNTILLNNFYTL